jgi:hypothetical protein
MPARRTVVLGGLFGATLVGDSFAAKSSARKVSAPQAKRIFHMYTSKDGSSAIREIPVPKFGNRTSARLLRRPAERVTVGTMAPNFMMDFHIANQPNFLIPIFGTLVVELKDGSRWTFGPGDILFAEDCTGSGHRSGAGPDGCFSVSVQIAKTEHCLETGRDPAGVLLGGDGPAT